MPSMEQVWDRCRYCPECIISQERTGETSFNSYECKLGVLGSLKDGEVCNPRKETS